MLRSMFGEMTMDVKMIGRRGDHLVIGSLLIRVALIVGTLWIAEVVSRP